MAYLGSHAERRRLRLWVRFGMVLSVASACALHAACSARDSQHRPAPPDSAGGIGSRANPAPGVAVDGYDSAGAPSLDGAPSTSGGGGAAGREANDGSAFLQAGSSGRVVPASLDSYSLVSGPILLDGLEGVSGVTYEPETDSFFVLSDVTHSLYEYNSDFSALLRTVSIQDGPTDTEDVTYLGDDRFAIAVEVNEIYVLTISPETDAAHMKASDTERYVVTAPPATVNTGFEGVTLRTGVGHAGQLIACQEGGAGVPIRVLSFERSTNPGTFSFDDGTVRVEEPWDALVTLGELATDLSSVAFDNASGTLLVLSQESSRLLRVAPDTGDVLDQRDLVGSPQYEGVTLASDGRLVLASEPSFVEIYRVPDE